MSLKVETRCLILVVMSTLRKLIPTFQEWAARYSADNKNGLISYALAVTQEIPEGIEPFSYSEAISCPNSSNWLMAM